MLKGVVLGLILGVVGVFAGAYFYFSTGQAPVATSSPEMPFERKFASMALHSYMNKLPHPNPAVPEDEKNFLEGAKVYKDNCAVCLANPRTPSPAACSRNRHNFLKASASPMTKRGRPIGKLLMASA